MASRFLFLLTSKTFVVFVTNTSKKNLSAKISKTLTHFETIDQREQFTPPPPPFSSTENVRNSVRIPRSRGGKNKGEEGNACTFRSRYAVSRLRTENGSASVQPLKRWEFCVTRGQRADERRGEREREREGELLLR